MFGLPLHPLVVHFPVVLAVFIPLLALWAFWHQRQRSPGRGKVWAAFVLAQAVLAVSAFLAVQTGEADEEKAEKRVSEARLEKHEDQGKRFALVSTGTTLLGAAGFLPAPLGMAAQTLALAATWAQFGFIMPVGHSGADLVHGANGVYAGGGQGMDTNTDLEKEDDD